MTGRSDEERYSRFRGERQGLTVMVDNTRPREDRPGRSRHWEDRAGGRRDQSHSLTVVVHNDRSCTQDQRSRPRQRENRDGSRGYRGALAERRRQERREQRERERYRPYPSQNLTGSRRGRSREQGQGRRAVSWSQRDRQDRDQGRGRVQQRGRARERGGRQSQGGRRREHNRERTDVGASRRPGLPSHVQQVVQMGAETVSAPSRSERVPSPPSVRRVYVDEPSQVVRASFSQLREFGGTLPSHEQMIGGPSTSTSVDEPSQVIKVSFTKLRGYGGRPPSHKQMIGGPSGSARVPVVSLTAPVVTPASAPVSSVTDQPASTGSGKKTASRECPLCKAWVLVLKRHVELEHLPWHFTPELACWKCQVGAENSCSLLDRHAGCRDGVFTEKRFLQWLQTMGLLLEELVKILSFSSGDELFQFCMRQGLYPQEKGVQLSPTREVYLLWLEVYHQRKASAVIIQPLSCLSALLNWNTMLQLLARMPEEQRRRIRDFPVHNAVWSSPQVPVTDGHCHLDLLADRWRVTCQQALQQVIEQAPDPQMLLQAVVSNCCFPKSWRNSPRVSADLGVRVALTFGVHPKVVDVPINWEEMDTLFWSAECVGIGECGLDRTPPHPEHQRQVFKCQVLAAKLTGKPLVLHLRGDTPQQDDEVYMEALDILTKECLPRRHPVYLHCFVASWKVYMAWAHRYNNLLLGITSKSVQAPDFGKVARSLPFERLALESDAPHLCPILCSSTIRPELSHASGTCPPSLYCLVLA